MASALPPAGLWSENLQRVAMTMRERGLASVAGAGLYSERLQRPAMTMVERGIRRPREIGNLFFRSWDITTGKVARFSDDVEPAAPSEQPAPPDDEPPALDLPASLADIWSRALARQASELVPFAGDAETRFELTVPSDAGPERRVRIDLPSGLRIRVALPQGAVPDAVVSFHLPDDVVRSLDAVDAHALHSMAFAVELDEPNVDDEAAAPAPPQQTPSPPQPQEQQRRECKPGLLYSDGGRR